MLVQLLLMSVATASNVIGKLNTELKIIYWCGSVITKCNTVSFVSVVEVCMVRKYKTLHVVYRRLQMVTQTN